MAQLIKLEDYVSRYEWNPFRYPSQFIRLKNENWKKLFQLWTEDQFPFEEAHSDKWRFFKQNDQNQKNNFPNTEEELKQYYLDQLFYFQLKWATSTVTELSFTKKEYHFDKLLKYFLQRFPDIYLIMYYPIFNVKNVPIDGDILVISPIGIEIIHMLEVAGNANIRVENGRTWTIHDGDRILTNKISPLISLKRTEQIVKGVLNIYNIDFPIQKTVLSRSNHMIFSSEPFGTRFIGKSEYEQWFKQKRQLRSSLKRVQLKTIEALLKQCFTTSIKRPEWEEDASVFSFDKES